MTDLKQPRTEIGWSRRAIINVVEVLQIHAESLTLVGAHAVLLRTMDLDVPLMPTGDGDLGVTPGLVGDVPSIEELLTDAGYEHRTTARPGLWGRTPYDEPDGTRPYREKIDLLAPHGLSGTASRSKRGVPNAPACPREACGRQRSWSRARRVQQIAHRNHRLRGSSSQHSDPCRRHPGAHPGQGIQDRRTASRASEGAGPGQGPR